jgi:hypothetical protein
MRDDRERLLDIVEAIERIEKYTARGRPAFDESELIQTCGNDVAFGRDRMAKDRRYEKHPCS